MWRMGVNLTHYKNVVTDLPLKDMPVTGVTRLKEGRSVYDFYLREWAGVDPDNGDPLWYKNVKDEQGNITGRTTTNDYAQADYYYVDKSSLPKVYGGFNTAFSYKGFELSAIFAYSIGGYIVEQRKQSGTCLVYRDTETLDAGKPLHGRAGPENSVQ